MGRECTPPIFHRQVPLPTKSKLALDPDKAPAIASYLKARAAGQPRARTAADSGLKVEAATLMTDADRRDLESGGYDRVRGVTPKVYRLAIATLR